MAIVQTTVTPSYIRTILLTGTYPDNTLTEDNVFDAEQNETRRRYPSCEIEFTSPESFLKDRKQSDKTLGFEIRYFQKRLAGGSDEVALIKQVEDAIILILETATLEDPNQLIITEQWERDYKQRDRTHPAYWISVLKVFVKTRLVAGPINDAVLIFRTSTSSVSVAPSQDYTYVECFDTEIMEGYRTHEEQVTVSPISPGVPIRFRGGYNSRFITHLPVKTVDFGTTGDKVNNLLTLLSSDEKPIIGLRFTKNTDDSPTIHTIQEDIKVDIERIERAYLYNDFVVYRVFGFLTQPSTLSAS